MLNKSKIRPKLPVAPPVNIRVMFDYCSTGLWESSGRSLSLEKLQHDVPPQFMFDLGVWMGLYRNLAQMEFTGEDVQSQSKHLTRLWELDRQGLMLAQRLNYHLRAMKPHIEYETCLENPACAGASRHEIQAVRSPWPKASSMLLARANEEVRDILSLLHPDQSTS